MYDWNALWHQHQGYRTGYDAPQDDINELAAALDAKRVKAAQGTQDIAVYEADDHFVLLGYADGLQILTLDKHTLCNIAIRFVTKDEGVAMTLPYVEIHVDNPATHERADWRGAVRRDETGRVWLEKKLLNQGIMPAMPFDELSFTDHANFRDAIYEAWQQALPTLIPEIEAWVPEVELQQLRLGRYLEILKHEQAALSRLFSAEERQLLNAALTGLNFDDPAACRGLWLKVEATLLNQGGTQDVEALLDKMRRLSYAQEVALIEAL